MADPNSVFYYYQKLIKLRKKYPVVVYGDYRLILEDDEQIFSYVRTLGDQQLLVILNFFKEKAHFSLPDTVRYRTKELLISNYEVKDDQIDHIELKPYEARVYLLKL